MIVCHVLSLDSVPSHNADCTMATTFCQLVASGVSYQVTEINHWRKCSSCIPKIPPERFRQSLRTAQAISLFSGMDSSTGNGCNPSGIGCTGGGTFRYSSTSSDVMVAMSTMDGDGGRYTASLYHPIILIHESRMRDRLEARRDSTADPSSAALRRRSSWRIALIM